MPRIERMLKDARRAQDETVAEEVSHERADQAERLTLAEKQGTPVEDILLMLLTNEISRRDSTAAARRAEDAGLDQDMLLERWDTLRR